MTNILKNVEVLWAKLEENNPDKGYQNAGPEAWTLDVILKPEDVQMWNTFGITSPAVKVGKDGRSSIRLKRKVLWKSGDRKDPVIVVDGSNMPFGIEKRSIGNGSICNVQFSSFSWNAAGRDGVSAELTAIQVVKLTEYAKSGALAFDIVDSNVTPAANISQPTATPQTAPIELGDVDNLF